MTGLVQIISVTRKGQATIPKRLREKYGIKGKIVIEKDEKGILIKPLPSPNDDYGSLKSAFKGKTTRQLIEEARKEESTKMLQQGIQSYKRPS